MYYSLRHVSANLAISGNTQYKQNILGRILATQDCVKIHISVNKEQQPT